jgi:hypothetical protein
VVAIAALGGQLPGLLAGGAVGLFEVLGGLLEGQLLAAEGDGHVAADRVVVGDELGGVGLERDVLVAEDLNGGLPLAGEDGVLFLRKRGEVGAGEELLLELEEEGLDLRLDLLDELEEAALDLLVVGVAALVDVAAGAVLIGDAGELGEVGEPAFEVGGGVQGAVEELAVEGFDLGPVGGVEFARDEGAGGGVGDHGWLLSRAGMVPEGRRCVAVAWWL